MERPAPRLGDRPPDAVFPACLSLDEVRVAIANRREFRLFTPASDPSVCIVSYRHPRGDSFPEATTRELAVLRECRGLVFDTATGRVVSRRYHKFFNVGEQPETATTRAAPLDGAVILEKLDGSMVAPWVARGLVVWATKMGPGPVADDVARFVSATAADVGYEALVRECDARGVTCIFEYCSAQRPVILNYARDALVCTALRDRDTGHYASYDDMVRTCSAHRVPVVQCLAHEGATTLAELLALMRRRKGLEGCVLRYRNGEMVKLKTDWYGLLVRGLQSVDLSATRPNQRHIWSLVIDEAYDDFKCTIAADERERLDRFNHDVFVAVDALVDRIRVLLDEKVALSDGEFAQWHKSSRCTFPASVCFRMRKGGVDADARAMVVEWMQRAVQDDVDAVRALLGPHLEWSNYPLAKRDDGVAAYSEWH